MAVESTTLQNLWDGAKKKKKILKEKNTDLPLKNKKNFK